MDGTIVNLGREEVSLSEVVELCAVDTALFCKVFFPKTCRQPFAPMHYEAFELLDDPNNRFVNLQFFRGAAKTSILRMFTMKRICYGLAHTAMYVGKSEGHAVRSVRWIKAQVQYNRLLREAFKLSPGNKWQDVEIEINHGIDNYRIWIMAMGITGSVRGVNQDDFRPDLIGCDDLVDEDNGATPDQRQKISNLVYGALKESLAPRSEAPDAKMVMLQTPINREDVSTAALKDAEWASAVYGCWARETKDLPLERRESAWPARWTSEELRDEKRLAAARNKISVFAREKECVIVAPETSSFIADWLQFYSVLPERHLMELVLVIDPVPPPTDLQIQKGLRGKDFEAFAVVGRYQGEFFLIDYETNRGHDPDWTINMFFTMIFKWRLNTVIVETVAYQKTLAWILRKAMEARRKYVTIIEFDDKRSKYDRIVDGINPIASNNQLFVREDHTDFISQYIEYPNVNHDDLLEAVANGLAYLNNNLIADQSDYFDLEEDDDGHYKPVEAYFAP